MLFLDVDHFKMVNDNFGHPAGDAVLVEFAKRLRASVRAPDIVARLSGDGGASAQGAALCRRLTALADEDARLFRAL